MQTSPDLPQIHCAERRGSILLLTAILLLVLLGVSGFALDAGNLTSYKHRMQSAADAAAVAGAREVKRKSSISNGDLLTFVQHDATNNGFTDGSNGISVTVNHGPATGTYAGDSKYVEVLISRAVPTYFMSLFGRTTVTVGARGVAGLSGGGNGCVYSLSSIAGKGLETSGSGSITLTGCDVYVNAVSSTAFCVGSGWTFTAQHIYVVGDDTCTSGTVNPAATTGSASVTDPLAGIATPTVGSPCINANIPTGATTTLSQGTYCGDLQVSGTGTVVNFNAGTYVITGGGLVVKSAATVNGTGVTFYTTGTKPSSFTNTTHINLSAPTTGTYAGILLFGIGDKPSNSNVFNSDDQQLNGIIYFPHQHIEWKGNGGSMTSLISDTIKFTGGSSLGADFSALAGGSPLAGGTVSKAE